MTDHILPGSIDFGRFTTRYRDSTAVLKNAYTGTVRTVSLLGDRLGVAFDCSPSGGRTTAAGLQDRARIMQFIARLRGRQNRAYLYDPGYVQRGSFPSAEQIPNNEFMSGTTGWINEASWTTSSADNVYRAMRNQSGAPAAFVLRSGGISGLTQFAPYAMRFFTALGAGLDPSTLTCRIDDYAATNGPISAWAAMRTQVHIPYGTSLRPSMTQMVPTVLIAGTFIDTLYSSMARCLLADNSPNLILQSDVFDNASWTKLAATITANTSAAPDGTTTADSLIESVSTSTHLTEQTATVSSAVADFADSFCVKAGTRNWCWIALVENTGGNSTLQYVNLSTGALGTQATQANWANARVSVTPLGNGWFRLSITATKTNAATVIRARLGMASADNTASYTGDGVSNILIWRGGLSGSPVAFLPAQTTTVASGGAAPSGNSINVKGGPASMAGALLPGDQVEILSSYGSELKLVREQLDLDAGGLGTLFFEPRLRGTVSDGAAIITCRPMGRFVYVGQADMEWTTDPGLITNASFEFDEAVG